MYRYRNSNTGDVIAREERSPRLDHLPNWELVGEPEPDEPPQDAPSPPPAPPAKSGAKADWIAWAVRCGADGEAAEALTKDQLIEQYGKGEE